MLSSESFDANNEAIRLARHQSMPDVNSRANFEKPLSTFNRLSLMFRGTSPNPVQTVEKKSNKGIDQALVNLIELEKNCINNLSVIIQCSEDVLRKKHLLSPAKIDNLLGNFPELFEVHHNFLKQLEEIENGADNHGGLGYVIMQMMNKLDTPYTKCCELQVKSLDACEEVYDNSLVRNFLGEAGLHGSDDSLHSYMASPFDTLFQYKELFMNVCNDVDPGDLEYALFLSASDKINRLSQIASTAQINWNEWKEVKDLQAKLDFSELNSAPQSRRLSLRPDLNISHNDFAGLRKVLRDDRFVRVKKDDGTTTEEQPIALVLLTDLLLLCEPKKRDNQEIYCLIKPPLPLENASLEPHFGEDPDGSCMELEVEGDERLLLRATEGTDKDSWLQEFKTYQIAKLLEETYNILDFDDQDDEDDVDNRHTMTDFNTDMGDTAMVLDSIKQTLDSLKDEMSLTNHRYSLDPSMINFDSTLISDEPVSMLDTNDLSSDYPPTSELLALEKRSSLALSPVEINFESTKAPEEDPSIDKRTSLISLKNDYFNNPELITRSSTEPSDTDAPKSIADRRSRTESKIDFFSPNFKLPSMDTAMEAPTIPPTTESTFARLSRRISTFSRRSSLPLPESAVDIVGPTNTPQPLSSTNFLTQKPDHYSVSPNEEDAKSASQKSPTFIEQDGENRFHSTSLEVPKRRSLAQRIMDNPRLSHLWNRSRASTSSMSSISSVSTIATIIDSKYVSEACDISQWRGDHWGRVGQCVLEVRETSARKSCIALLTEGTQRQILNAWILPDTIIERSDKADVIIVCQISRKTAKYRIRSDDETEADEIYEILMSEKEVSTPQSNEYPANDTFISRSDSLLTTMSVTDEVRCVFESKCKLFLLEDGTSWARLGSTIVQLMIAFPSQRMKLIVESTKSRRTLINADVPDRGVERRQKRIIVTLLDDRKLSHVHLLTFKNITVATHLFELLTNRVGGLRYTRSLSMYGG